MSKEKAPKVTNSLTDGHGNTLWAVNNSKTVVLSLELFAEKKKRRVGIIDIKRRMLSVVRKRQEHTLHKIGAYGFNYKLLKEAKLFDTVLVIDEQGKYQLTREEIINNGQIMNFVKQGFELQIFYKLSELINFKKQ